MTNPDADTTCTTDDCNNPTSTYLCTNCVTELQRTMKQIPDLLPVLAMIARKEEQPFTIRSATRPHNRPGPTTPLNLSAASLAQNLHMATAKTPNQYAQDHDGAWAKTYIEQQVHLANLMVHGETESKPTPDYLKFRMRSILPLPTRHLVPWFAETLGIRISPERIKKWGQRGVIPQHGSDGKHPAYHPADVLRALHERDH